MASTRNNNTPGDYCYQQKQYALSRQHLMYPNSQAGAAYDTKLPGRGLNPGQIPDYKLSYNGIDIESFLFGINSTNLVNRAPIFKPELKKLPSVNLFEVQPTVMPIPFIMDTTQRPFPVPN